MRRRPAEQLPLMILTDSVDLHEELAQWKAHALETQQTLRLAEADNAQLRQQLRLAEADNTALRQQLRAVTAQREIWRSTAEAYGAMADARSASSPRETRDGAPLWLGQELLKLVRMSHPDRWSQGQSATALAHEILVGLNAMRQRLAAEGQ